MKLTTQFQDISKHSHLIAVIVLAFFLGLGNLFFDFPLAFTVGDEFESQRVALEILNSYSLRHYSTYFPLWSWIQLPFIVITLLVLKVFGFFSSFEAVKNEVLLYSPGLFMFIPRLLSAIVSSLAVIWLYKIGKTLKSGRLGLIMSILFCFNFLRVQ